MEKIAKETLEIQLLDATRVAKKPFANLVSLNLEYKGIYAVSPSRTGKYTVEMYNIFASFLDSWFGYISLPFPRGHLNSNYF